MEFGAILRDWRQMRRLSQLDLSLAAGVSSRHLSFLESGRSAPSRGMVLRLAGALGMPKGAANDALKAAGFAAAFPSLPAHAPDLAPIRRAISITLERHAPFPAVAIDRHWTLIDANEPAITLLSPLGPAGNMIEVLLAAVDLVENWEETALLSLARLKAEIAHLGGDERLEALATRLAEHPRLAAFDIGRVDFNQAVIPTILKIGGRRLSLFSAIAQFGAVQDIEASEIRIELMYPADEETATFFERFATES
ncbi:MAG TPA: helix-turn-helix domain-containing protein [Parvularculaceae bacterium]|nr:helix-turn-helix domain-containing protein [Parvularculaceae bacterium]